MKTCVDCGDPAKRPRRGLCDACYRRHQRNGTVDRFDVQTIARRQEVSPYDFQEVCARGRACDICGKPAVDMMRGAYWCRACLCADEPQPYPYTAQAIDATTYNGEMWDIVGNIAGRMR